MSRKSGGVLLDKLKKFDKAYNKAIRGIFIDLGLEKRDDKIDGPDPNRFTGFDDYFKNKKAKGGEIKKMNKGGLAEATAKLKAKGLKDGGMAVKDKVVAVDKSPNSGLITTKGFGKSRRT